MEKKHLKDFFLYLTPAGTVAEEEAVKFQQDEEYEVPIADWIKPLFGSSYIYRSRLDTNKPCLLTELSFISDVLYLHLIPSMALRKCEPPSTSATPSSQSNAATPQQPTSSSHHQAASPEQPASSIHPQDGTPGQPPAKAAYSKEQKRVRALVAHLATQDDKGPWGGVNATAMLEDPHMMNVISSCLTHLQLFVPIEFLLANNIEVGASQGCSKCLHTCVCLGTRF